MESLKALTELGKEMGYEGDKLREFVKDQQDREREERKAKREMLSREQEVEREKQEYGLKMAQLENEALEKKMKNMEPDDTADKAAGLELRSKIAYFNSQNKAQENTPTNKKVFRKGPPPPPRPSLLLPPSKLETTTFQPSPIDITREEPESPPPPAVSSPPIIEQKSLTEDRRSDVESNVESKVELPSESPPTPTVSSPLMIEHKSLTEDRRSEFESNAESKVETPSESPSPPTVSSQPIIEQKSQTEDRRLSHKLNDELRAKTEEVAARKGSGWSPNDMEIFKRPMCLIGADQTNTLTISTEVVSQLEIIDWPMVVVSVVGLYRTGKSYLMNRLAESTTGFALGDTIESTTKGIWAWCKMHPKKKNTVLLLLDTEGLGDVDKGDQNHDNKIFTLATLLCNCLVYNMKGAFDQDAVNKLTFVTEMASNIRYRGKSSEDNQTLNLILPDFVLCVRDFSLKLSKGGKKITEDEYLEHGLAEQTGKADQFNKPRECIRKYFPKRKCFTFPVPGDGDVLENLETLRFDQLSNKFKEATVHFISHIYGKNPKELVTSKPVNGLMFATLAHHYVNAIRHGAVPDVDDAFLAVAKIENAKIQKETLANFESQMKKIVMPVSAAQLEKCYTNAQQKALKYLRTNVVHDKDGEFENNAQMIMDNIWNTFKKENLVKVKEMCETKLQEAFSKSLKGNIEKKAFEVAGGYRKFQRNIEILKEEYFSSLRDFEEHEVSWAWLGLINETKNAESMIIQADEDMSQKEKEDEKKRSEEQFNKVIEQHKNANKEALAHQKREMDAHHQKIDEERKRQMADDQRKFENLTQEKLAREAAQRELAEFKKQQEDKKRKMDEQNRKRKADRAKQAKERERALNELAEERKRNEVYQNALAVTQNKQREESNKWFGARMWNAFWND